MDGNSVAAIIGAAGGLVAGLLTTLLNHRRLTKKLKNTSMVDNFQTLYIEMRTEITRLRDEQAEERRQWATERTALNEKIDKLNEVIRTQDKAIHAKEIEVTELHGKVNLLTAQLEVYKENHQATKSVTIKT